MGFKFNPFTGTLDIAGPGSSAVADNFSYKFIGSGETIEVPENQQMLVDGPVRVLGHLNIRGDLVDVSNRQREQFLYDLIDTGNVVEVLTGRLLVYKGHFRILGHIRVNGRLEEI